MLILCHIVLCFLLASVASEKGDEWQTPDAWGRAKSDGNLIGPPSTILEGCPKLSYTEDVEHIKLYYAKLLKFIFDGDQMNFDKSSNYYGRNIYFKATEKQLHTLKNSKNPRDWDNIMNDILSSTDRSECTCQNNIFKNIYIFFEDYGQMVMNSSELKFALLFGASLMAILYFQRKYKYGFFSLVMLGCGAWGYYKSYKECNREMEAMELVKVLSEKTNPCDQLKPSFYARFFFGQEYYEQRCVEYLKSQNNDRWQFCDPGHVFMKYLNEIFFDQVFIIVEKSAHVIQKSAAKFGFPFNYIAIFVVGLFLYHFLKFCVKCLFISITHASVVSNVLRRSSNATIELTTENIRHLQQRLNLSTQPVAPENSIQKQAIMAQFSRRNST